jgi:hypothetical protein
MIKFLNNKWIIIIISIGLISVKFYFLYLCDVNNNFSNEAIQSNFDASHYLTIGKNIADYNVYSDTNSKSISEIATWRPPFWPFVLSILFKISSNFFILMVLKAILEVVLIALLLFKFKKDAAMKGMDLLPFFIVFVEPQYLKYSMSFLSESLSSILILGLTIFFVSFKKTKSHQFVIPILASMIILCHPVSIFFVISLFSIYLIIILRSNFSRVFLPGLLFLLLLLAWPCRNYLTFDKGFYLTASQGATFSKGWNEKVASQFTNVEGDLGDESLNLKYVDSKLLILSKSSVLDMSNLYSQGTKKYIKGLSLEEKIRIALIKMKSNFNPFPEKPKPGFLESTSIFFRILYLIVFLQMIYRFLRKEKINFDLMKDRIYLVILAIFMGQAIMSVYVYTGIRFNSIYSLTMLFCFVYLNKDFIRGSLKKIVFFKFQKTI